MTTKENPISGQASGADNNRRSDSNSLTDQRQRILNHLRVNGSLTTVEARRSLDIMHPSGRVMELKRQGHQIESHRVNDVTEAGKTHRVARYLLRVAGGDHD